MNGFTPYSALLGGLLIGLAATLLLWLDGRIAGISGIAAGLVAPERNQPPGAWVWRGLFLLGLIAGTAAMVQLGAARAPARPQFQPGWLVLAGLLVGYGTALAHGCTSGHGVCGLARLSLRSLVATVVFLVMGIVTTFVARHLLGVAS